MEVPAPVVEVQVNERQLLTLGALYSFREWNGLLSL